MRSEFDSQWDSYRFPIVPCLNNKLLIIDPRHIKRVVLLDEACDEYPGDWDVVWHQSGIYPLELFNILEKIADSEDGVGIDGDDVSEKLMGLAQKVVKEHNLNTEDIRALTEQMHFHYMDGTTETFGVCNGYDEVAAQVVDLLASQMDGNEKSFPSLRFMDASSEADFTIPMENTSLVELPFLKIDEASSGCDDGGE